MIQIVTYIIQLFEIVFLCRSLKVSRRLIVIALYIGAVAVIGVDRKYIVPEIISWVAAFLIALHYVMLSVVSLYLVFWILFRNLYREDMGKIQIIVLFVGLVTTLFGYYNGMIPTTNYYTIKTDKVTEDLRIVQISDLHICRMYNAEEISDLVNAVNELNPDIICITGDIYDGWRAFAVDMEDVYKEFRRLSPRYGTYVCYGNHDAPFTYELAELCKQSGFRLLIDGTVEAGDVRIIGRGCSPDGCKLSHYGIDSDTFTIVLDHKPDRVEEAAENNVDLLLCGHTHGGQLLSIKLMFNMEYDVDAGSKQYGDTLVIVNQGASLSYPYCRVFGKSEVVCVDIKSDKKGGE